MESSSQTIDKVKLEQIDKEKIVCQKITFYNPYIFSTLSCKTFIFLTLFDQIEFIV